MHTTTRRGVYTAVLAAWCTLFAVASPAYGGSGLDIIPAQTRGLVTVENLSRLHTVLGISDLRQTYPELFREAEAEMTRDLGFSLLDLDAVRANGIDPDRPVYLSFSLKPTFSMAVLLPGGEDALELIRGLMESEGGSSRRVQYEGVEITIDEDDSVALFISDRYLVVVVADPDERDASALDAAERFIEQSRNETIAQADRFQQLNSKVPGEFDVTVYVSPDLWRDVMELEEADEYTQGGVTPDETLELYEKWKLNKTATVFKTKVESDRLTVESYTRVDGDSEIMKWYEVGNDPIAFLQRLPSDPMLVALGRINSAAVWRSVEEAVDVFESSSMPPIDESLDEASGEVGLDIEDDLIEQIDGNIGLIINDVSSTGADAIFVAQLSDTDLFNGTLARFAVWLGERIAEESSSSTEPSQTTYLTEEESDGVPFYMMSMQDVDICFGIVEDHLVVASSLERFRTIIQGDGSFVDVVGDDRVRAALEDRTGSVFYLDFKALSRDLESILSMFGPESDEALRMLAELSELVSTSVVEKEGLRQTWTLTGAYPDTWQRLIARRLEEAAAAARWRAAEPDSLEDSTPDNEQ